MKRQIHAYRGHGEIAVEGHNVKLGRGGIREIEFFVQTQQLIAGGRHPELRAAETLAALAALAQGGWIEARARASCDAAYRFLRRVENRLQMVADEQTQTLPSDRGALEASPALRAFPTATRSRRRCSIICATCSGTTPPCSSTRRAPSRQRGAVFPARCRRPRDRSRKLCRDGLSRSPLEASAHGAALAGTAALSSLRSAFARAQLAELVPLLIDQFGRSDRSGRGARAFDRFLGGAAGRRPAASRCCARIPSSSR